MVSNCNYDNLQQDQITRDKFLHQTKNSVASSDLVNELNLADADIIEHTNIQEAYVSHLNAHTKDICKELASNPKLNALTKIFALKLPMLLASFVDIALLQEYMRNKEDASGLSIASKFYTTPKVTEPLKQSLHTLKAHNINLSSDVLTSLHHSNIPVEAFASMLTELTDVSDYKKLIGGIFKLNNLNLLSLVEVATKAKRLKFQEKKHETLSYSSYVDIIEAVTECHGLDIASVQSALKIDLAKELSYLEMDENNIHQKTKSRHKSAFLDLFAINKTKRKSRGTASASTTASYTTATSKSSSEIKPHSLLDYNFNTTISTLFASNEKRDTKKQKSLVKLINSHYIPLRNSLYTIYSDCNLNYEQCLLLLNISKQKFIELVTAYNENKDKQKKKNTLEHKKDTLAFEIMSDLRSLSAKSATYTYDNVALTQNSFDNSMLSNTDRFQYLYHLNENEHNKVRANLALAHQKLICLDDSGKQPDLLDILISNIRTKAQSFIFAYMHNYKRQDLASCYQEYNIKASQSTIATVEIPATDSDSAKIEIMATGTRDNTVSDTNSLDGISKKISKRANLMFLQGFNNHLSLQDTASFSYKDVQIDDGLAMGLDTYAYHYMLAKAKCTTCYSENKTTESLTAKILKTERLELKSKDSNAIADIHTLPAIASSADSNFTTLVAGVSESSGLSFATSSNGSSYTTTACTPLATDDLLETFVSDNDTVIDPAYQDEIIKSIAPAFTLDTIKDTTDPMADDSYFTDINDFTNNELNSESAHEHDSYHATDFDTKFNSDIPYVPCLDLDSYPKAKMAVAPNYTPIHMSELKALSYQELTSCSELETDLESNKECATFTLDACLDKSTLTGLHKRAHRKSRTINAKSYGTYLNNIVNDDKRAAYINGENLLLSKNAVEFHKFHKRKNQEFLQGFNDFVKAYSKRHTSLGKDCNDKVASFENLIANKDKVSEYTDLASAYAKESIVKLNLCPQVHEDDNKSSDTHDLTLATATVFDDEIYNSFISAYQGSSKASSSKSTFVFAPDSVSSSSSDIKTYLAFEDLKQVAKESHKDKAQGKTSCKQVFSHVPSVLTESNKDSFEPNILNKRQTRYILKTGKIKVHSTGLNRILRGSANADPTKAGNIRRFCHLMCLCFYQILVRSYLCEGHPRNVLSLARTPTDSLSIFSMGSYISVKWFLNELFKMEFTYEDLSDYLPSYTDFRAILKDYLTGSIKVIICKDCGSPYLVTRDDCSRIYKGRKANSRHEVETTKGINLKNNFICRNCVANTHRYYFSAVEKLQVVDMDNKSFFTQTK